MHIKTYISDLLYRYDCVTIPEFGAFLTKRVSAIIEEDKATFLPPKKVISFNEQLQHNDGILATYIAEAERTSYEDAVAKINSQVKAIKTCLIEGETLNLKNIGALALNAEGKIVFEPAYDHNYLTEAFGLSPVSANTVKREVYKQHVETLEDLIPISITPEKRENPSRSYNYLKYAAVAIVALAIGGIGLSTYNNSGIESQNRIAQEAVNQQLDTKVQEATFIIENPLPAATLNVEKKYGRYHIIAGAFRVEENSDKKVEELRALGFKARTIGENKYGLHEVVYSSYENSQEALDALKAIRKEHNQEAWLLVKDLN